MDEEIGVKAVNSFARDVVALANGIAGKKPEDINFAAIQEYLELLKEHAARVEEGIYSRDNSILYTSGGEVSFDKNQVTK